MRALVLMLAGLAIALLLAGSDLSLASPGSGLTGMPSSQVSTPAPGLQFACTRKQCRDLCPNGGGPYKNCYRDCRRRSENC
jgi:hypothetical protein